MNDVIITMAGKGTRTNKEVPKQFLKVSQDKYLFEISLDKFIRTGCYRNIVLVVNPEYVEWVKNRISNNYPGKLGRLITVIPGGDTAQHSRILGFESLLTDEESLWPNTVTFHDGVRVGFDENLLTFMINNCRFNSTAYVPYIPATGTLRLDSDKVVYTKDKYMRLQTPMVFPFYQFYGCYNKAKDKGIEYQTASDLYEDNGGLVNYVMGNRLNFKVTFAEDIDVVRLLYNHE
jgi:2-C-methyl-D-erythritol 4-phosphate cytidylyltransferase